jgi:hypothetical protein
VTGQGRHEWFRGAAERTECAACGQPDCFGRIAVDFCPLWQEADERNARGEYLQTRPIK